MTLIGPTPGTQNLPANADSPDLPTPWTTTEDGRVRDADGNTVSAWCRSLREPLGPYIEELEGDR